MRLFEICLATEDMATYARVTVSSTQWEKGDLGNFSMFPHCCVLDVHGLQKNRKLLLKVALWVVAVKLCTLKEERTEQIDIVGRPCTCVLREQKKLTVFVGWCSPGIWPWKESCIYKEGIRQWASTVVCLKKYLRGIQTCVRNSLIQC